MKKSTTPAIQEYLGGKLWHLRENAEVTVGLTAATIEEIGAVQSVDFPETSGLVEEGDVIAIVEGENDTFEVTAPCDGMILEVNDALEEEANLVSEDPSEQGWLIKIEPDDALDEESDEDDSDDDEDSDDEDSDEDSDDEDDDLDEEDEDEEEEDEEDDDR